MGKDRRKKKSKEKKHLRSWKPAPRSPLLYITEHVGILWLRNSSDRPPRHRSPLTPTDFGTARMSPLCINFKQTLLFLSCQTCRIRRKPTAGCIQPVTRTQNRKSRLARPESSTMRCGPNKQTMSSCSFSCSLGGIVAKVGRSCPVLVGLRESPAGRQQPPPLHPHVHVV